jgi:hypothetical protein
MKSKYRRSSFRNRKEIKFVLKNHQTKIGLTINDIIGGLGLNGFTSLERGGMISHIRITQTLNELIRRRKVFIQDNHNAEGESTDVVFILSPKRKRTK